MFFASSSFCVVTQRLGMNACVTTQRVVISVPRDSNHCITFYRVIPTGTTWLQEIVWQVYHMVK